MKSFQLQLRVKLKEKKEIHPTSRLQTTLKMGTIQIQIIMLCSSEKRKVSI
jgi:hypothetical protein